MNQVTPRFDHEDAYWGNATTKIEGSNLFVASHARRIEIDTITGVCTTSHSGGTRSVGKSKRIVPFTPLLTEKKQTDTNHIK